MASALSKTRGGGAWARRGLIVLGTGVAAIGSYVLTLGDPQPSRDLVAQATLVFGAICVVIDLWMSRRIRRAGGVQAIRTGVGTGPKAAGSRFWIQAEGMRFVQRFDDATKFNREALSLFREAKDAQGIGLAMLGQGEIAEAQTRYADAQSAYADAQQQFIEAKDERGQMRSLLLQARAQSRQNALDQARSFYERRARSRYAPATNTPKAKPASASPRSRHGKPSPKRPGPASTMPVSPSASRATDQARRMR